MSELPKDIQDKIDEWLKPFFPDVNISVCTGPIDQEKRNEVQRHKRNCLKKGAEYGYSLSLETIASLKAELDEYKSGYDICEQEIKLRRSENERQAGEIEGLVSANKKINMELLEKAFHEYRGFGKIYLKEAWQNFKTENNL